MGATRFVDALQQDGRSMGVDDVIAASKVRTFTRLPTNIVTMQRALQNRPSEGKSASFRLHTCRIPRWTQLASAVKRTG